MAGNAGSCNGKKKVGLFYGKPGLIGKQKQFSYSYWGRLGFEKRRGKRFWPFCHRTKSRQMIYGN